MDEIAQAIGYMAMAFGGLFLVAAIGVSAARMTWQAWRKWVGFFNIVDALSALKEKQRDEAQKRNPNHDH